jgi:hypothetical protein
VIISGAEAAVHGTVVHTYLTRAAHRQCFVVGAQGPRQLKSAAEMCGILIVTIL